MNKKILVVLALASLFIATQATYTAVQCNSVGTTADANCASCPNSAAATCTLCNDGYVLVSGVCTACADTGCKTCTSTTTGTCTAAKTGYYLAANPGTPAACLTNCGVCTGTTYALCTTCKAGYWKDSTNSACTACGDTAAAGCSTCTSATAGSCTSNVDGYFGSSVATPATPTACNSVAGCKVCTAATAATCTSAATNYYLTANPGTATQCSDPNAATCSATASLTCTKGTLDTAGLCCGVVNCATCAAAATVTNANNVCATCSSGYGLVSGACTVCGVTNCGTCDTTVATCTACKTGYTLSSNTCVSTTPVPTTSSPSSAFNVTPVAVYTSTDTTAPAFSAVASASAIFGPGFDSTTAYVWLVDAPALTTGTYAVNRRTINTTAFSKSNSSADTAITTSISGSISSILTAVAPGYLGLATYMAGANWNTATATASEISITYISGNGTATTKAITGNTNTNVFYKLLSHWYLNGTFYVAYAMSTHTVGTASVADSFALNGIYIHGVVVSTGALLNYTTGGVKMLSLTQSNTGATTCIALTNTGCTTQPSSQVSTFKVGTQNFTQNSDTVWYLWEDQSTANAYTIKLGSINVTTGAATSGTTLTTSAASTGSNTAASPTITTSYSIAGFHSSDSGSMGAYINKLVTSTALSVSTYTSTVMSFINGTSTVQSTLYSLTPPTGYTSTSIWGYGTTDGFILVQSAYSQATTTPAQPVAVQAQRFYTNGTAYTTSAVALGTYSATPQFYQDTNGTIVGGYTLSDSLTGNTYSGYMGAYVVQAMAANTLTSIFAILSLLIVALFAF